MTYKYLQITIHDNDFNIPGEQMSHVLLDIFKFLDKHPKEEDLNELKEYIANIWWSIHSIESILGWGCIVSKDYFLERIDIKIVTENEMISIYDSNMEYIYIPLFESDIILFGKDLE